MTFHSIASPKSCSLSPILTLICLSLSSSLSPLVKLGDSMQGSGQPFYCLRSMCHPSKRLNWWCDLSLCVIILAKIKIWMFFLRCWSQSYPSPRWFDLYFFALFYGWFDSILLGDESPQIATLLRFLTMI